MNSGSGSPRVAARVVLGAPLDCCWFLAAFVVAALGLALQSVRCPTTVAGW